MRSRLLHATATILGVAMMASGVFAQVRRPAVAGSFYPGNADELEREVRGFLDAAPRPAAPARAVIVPHAGYVFSGATAGRAFASLLGAEIERVILLGPSHHSAFSGAALPGRGVKSFATPLGTLPVDQAAVAALRKSSLFDGPSSAHDPEHCLEVELPFVQVALGEVTVVPILVGRIADRETARAIARELAPLVDEHTAVVVSSDFTHHGAAYGYAPFGATGDVDEALVRLGTLTAERAAAIDARGFWQQITTSEDTVCGARPITVLLELLSHAFDGRGRVEHVTTSAEVSHNVNQIVTYAAVTFTGRWQSWREAPPAPALSELDEAERGAALTLARATLETHLTHAGQLAEWFAAHPVAGNLAATAAVFVTINTRDPAHPGRGRLRGCIGSLEAREPLVDAIVHAAVSAAHDPRFPALAARELSEITVEVSVLSPLHEVAGPEAIKLGRHGVLLSKGGRQAVFLPQVGTEYGWDLDTFLTQLSLKAGLPGDAWRRGARFEVFTAQVFGEEG